jgi:hypothetical protein
MKERTQKLGYKYIEEAIETINHDVKRFRSLHELAKHLRISRQLFHVYLKEHGYEVSIKINKKNG